MDDIPDELINPHHCVSNNLHQTARAITRIYGQSLSPTGIKRSQFSVLAYLMKLGTIRVTELADQMYIERTTMGRNLKPLQSHGFVTIRKSDDDGRAKEVTLTPLGVKKFKEALKCWRQAQEKIVNQFGIENWQALEASLKKLRRLSPSTDN